MKEYKLTETSELGNLPAVVNMWSKIKRVLSKGIEWDEPAIIIEFSEKEEKVLREVHDFLFQEIKFPELHNFFFKEIHLFGGLKNKSK